MKETFFLTENTVKFTIFGKDREGEFSFTDMVCAVSAQSAVPKRHPVYFNNRHSHRDH